MASCLIMKKAVYQFRKGFRGCFICCVFFLTIQLSQGSFKYGEIGKNKFTMMAELFVYNSNGS